MIKRLKFKNELGYPMDVVVDIVDGQSIVIKRLEDDKNMSIKLNNIESIEDLPIDKKNK